MKLWWPHCEALIAYLMAYSHSREPVLLDRFKQIYDYTFTHVRDVSFGVRLFQCNHKKFRAIMFFSEVF